MFDPIFDLSHDGFWIVVLILSIAVNGAGYAWTIGHAFVRWIDDKKTYAFSPFVYLVELGDVESKRVARNSEERAMEFVFGALGQLVLTAVGIIILTAAINWAWLPVALVSGLVVLLKTLRGVVRLKKQLNSHVKDKDAHK